METAEAMETWEKLEIKDDFLFAKVMRDKKICRMLLEKLLQIEIKDIVYLEEQKTLAIGKDAKSVRLDVYLEEGDRVFDLEMQTTNKRNLPKRSRYYQGMIDLNTIEKRAMLYLYARSTRFIRERHSIHLKIFAWKTRD